jgi:hypothetical protein
VLGLNSWDLFRTLCHARNGNAGEAPIHEHYPIAENVAKVQPDDIIVSEYYDPEKATRIVREVCGLGNQVIVTERGKTDGSVWLSLPEKPIRHTGDNLHCDVLEPRKHGIQTTQVTQHEHTPTEREFINQGDAALANVIREARLKTWNDDPTLRGLQLHQIERNFPFLLKAAHALNEKMTAGGYTRLLLCSRDCYLLCQLMWCLFPDQSIRYFFNSRLTRYRPTGSYAEYAKEMIGDGKTLIVDMNGSGNSLKYFTDRFGGDPLLVVSHTNTVPFLAAGGIRETSNPAPHGTVTNVIGIDIGGERLFRVESGDLYPQVRVRTMVDAFFKISDIAIRGHLPEPSYSLDWALRRMEDPRTACLWEDHLADCKATYELLKSGPLPHEVVL